jgi:CelD/BcsL family acetyltransferase involved in cellulose biosynthesis
MVVYRSGRPDCMLVGWLHQGSVAFKVGSFALFRSDVRILRFVNGGFLGNQSRGNSRFLVREILKSLRRREAQAVEFSQLRVDSPLYDLAKREPSVFCREHFTPVQTHRYVALPASFDEFLRGRSPKSHQEFRRIARTLVRDFPGKVRFQSVRSERDVQDFARKADEISQKTYQRALGAGFVNDLEMREMLRAAAQKAALRACLLYIGERPVAFASGIVSNETLYGTFTGYDPGFKKYRPGLQTLMRLIEESFEPSGSLLRVDAGSGDSPYKRAVFDSSWKEAPIWIFAPSARGLSLHVLKVVSTLLHSLAMGLLARSGHLRRVKKMWHRQTLRQFQRKVRQDIETVSR